MTAKLCLVGNWRDWTGGAAGGGEPSKSVAAARNRLHCSAIKVTLTTSFTSSRKSRISVTFIRAAASKKIRGSMEDFVISSYTRFRKMENFQ